MSQKRKPNQQPKQQPDGEENDDLIRIVTFSIRIPEEFSNELKIWAALKGTRRSQLASNILQSRVEANQEWIDSRLQQLAESRNLTIAEVRENLLSRE